MLEKTGKNSKVNNGDPLNGRRLRRSTVVGIVAGVVALAGISLWIMPRARAAFSPEATVTPVSVDALAAGERPPALVVTATSFGLDRDERRIPAGRYLLVVLNRTGIADKPIDLTITPVGRTEAALTRKIDPFGDLVQILDFAPGEYIVSESNKPEIQLRIIAG